jgi:hypothetical protein
MYLLDNKQHHTPHIHVRYAEFEAVFDIVSGDLLAGNLPKKQTRLVQAWIELHVDELLADWQIALAGQLPYKIDPL